MQIFVDLEIRKWKYGMFNDYEARQIMDLKILYSATYVIVNPEYNDLVP